MHKNHDLSILEDQLEDPLDQLDADGLAETPPPDPEMMLTLLVSTDAPQKMLAARAFCELQEERAIPPLIELLKDICPLVRVSAAYALGRNTHVDAVSPLIQLLENDWNGYVRKGVAWALGNCRDRRALYPLIHALRTDISAVRLWSASSLAQIASLEYGDVLATLPPLIEGLRRDSMGAVRSLSLIHI